MNRTAGRWISGLIAVTVLGFFGREAPAGSGAPPAARRPRVVIDPGHGGSNLGAASAILGRHEKHVTLAVSARLREHLRARGIDVELTREHDRTLTLRQRVALANQRAADAFISVHANASTSRTRRGFETFLLTPAGVDVDGRALRADATTPRPGVDAATALILDDVERGAAQWASADLAVAVQRALREVRGAEHDRGVRQDAHHVLLGATMPAVLVEIGFVDHPAEGRELLDPAVQDRIAAALARAIAATIPASPAP